jgi:hypothetical protein
MLTFESKRIAVWIFSLSAAALNRHSWP